MNQSLVMSTVKGKLENLGLEGLHFGIPLPKLLTENENNLSKKAAPQSKKRKASAAQDADPDDRDTAVDALPKRGRKLLANFTKRAKHDTLKMSDGIKESRVESAAAYSEMRSNMYSLWPAIERRRLETTVDFSKIGQSDYSMDSPSGKSTQMCRAAYELKDLWRAAKAEAAGKSLTTHLQHLVSCMRDKYEEVKVKLASGEDEHTDCARALQEEIQRQRREVAEQRAMRNRIAAQQAQNHITGKIKSKSYHRALRKRSIRKESEKLLRLKTENPQEYEKLREKMERQRVEERITQRHRMGKFAQLTKVLGKRTQNPEAGSLLAESLELARERLKKNELDVGDVSEDDSDEDEDKHATESTDEEDKEEKTVSDDEDDEKPKVVSSSSNIVTKITSLPNTIPATSDLAESVMRINASLPTNKALSEFAREMAKEQEDGLLQQMGNKKFMPGWNSWTGPGMENVDRQREKKYRQKRLKMVSVKPAIVSKGKLGYVRNVIAKETKNKLVKTIAFPYNTMEQFNEVLSQPVMREFTTEVFHRKKIAPKVKVRAGSIVKPMVVTQKK